MENSRNPRKSAHAREPSSRHSTRRLRTGLSLLRHVKKSSSSCIQLNGTDVAYIAKGARRLAKLRAALGGYHLT